jgi:hypothetical protein
VGVSVESNMKKLIVTIATFAAVSFISFCLAGLPAGYARGGMHGGMHGTGSSALGAPANPAVPPSLTPDSRLTGSAPLPPHHQPTRADVAGVTLKPDPEDAKVDKMIGNICRGC